MTKIELLRIVDQGSLNYYSKHVEIICEQTEPDCYAINLYINKELKETITVEHDNVSILYNAIDDTVEELKLKAYMQIELV